MVLGDWPKYISLPCERPCLCICMRLCTHMVEGGMVSPPCSWSSCASASWRIFSLMGPLMMDISTFQLGRILAKESSSMTAILKWSPHWSAIVLIVR